MNQRRIDSEELELLASLCERLGPLSRVPVPADTLYSLTRELIQLRQELERVFLFETADRCAAVDVGFDPDGDIPELWPEEAPPEVSEFNIVDDDVP